MDIKTVKQSVKLFYTRPIEPISYANAGDAGIDLRSAGVFVVDLDGERHEVEADSYEVKPGERILAKTGVVLALPEGTFGNIRDRSGLAFKHGIHTLAGVIDSTYRGEIGVVLVNLGSVPVMIAKNERIAQLIVCPYIHANLETVSSEEALTITVRGSGGFGSTGK